MAKKINNVKYIVHTMDACPYCNQAKGLLEYYEADYELVYEKSLDWETYPCIYRVASSGDPELIGGFNELANFSLKNGL